MVFDKNYKNYCFRCGSFSLSHSHIEIPISISKIYIWKKYQGRDDVAVSHWTRIDHYSTKAKIKVDFHARCSFNFSLFIISTYSLSFILSPPSPGGGGRPLWPVSVCPWKGPRFWFKCPNYSPELWCPALGSAGPVSVALLWKLAPRYRTIYRGQIKGTFTGAALPVHQAVGSWRPVREVDHRKTLWPLLPGTTLSATKVRLGQGLVVQWAWNIEIFIQLNCLIKGLPGKWIFLVCFGFFLLFKSIFCLLIVLVVNHLT